MYITPIIIINIILTLFINCYDLKYNHHMSNDLSDSTFVYNFIIYIKLSIKLFFSLSSWISLEFIPK